MRLLDGHERIHEFGVFLADGPIDPGRIVTHCLERPDQ
jgi:hypothetical protein